MKFLLLLCIYAFVYRVTLSNAIFFFFFTVSCEKEKKARIILVTGRPLWVLLAIIVHDFYMPGFSLPFRQTPSLEHRLVDLMEKEFKGLSSRSGAGRLRHCADRQVLGGAALPLPLMGTR